MYDKKLEVENWQLLFAWSGSRWTSFGPHIWYWSKGLLNYHTWKIVIDENKVNKSFFNHALKKLTKYIEDHAHWASALVHTQKWEMEWFDLPLPKSKTEQSAIASILSDTDLLIENLDKLIEKKKAIKQGTMQELLTGKRRLPGFSWEWVEKALGDLLDYVQPTKFLVHSTDYSESYDIPVLTAGKTFILGYTNEDFWLFADLPTIIFDDFTTAIKYVDFKFKAKSSAMKMLIPKNSWVNLRFVFEKMQMIEFPLWDHKRHWIWEYKNLKISVPESPIEQKAITEILVNQENEISILETKLRKTKEIKQGMMQQLLTGNIRVYGHN